MQWLAYFSIFGAQLGLLQCVGQIILGKQRLLNRLLALLFLLLSALIITALLFMESQSWPRIVLIHLPVLGSVGPILYLIHGEIQEQPSQSGRSYVIHLSIAASFWLLFVILILQPKETLRQGLEGFQTGLTVYDWFFVIPLFMLLSYMIALLFRSRLLFRFTVLKDEWTARILLFLILATLLNHGVGAFYLLFRTKTMILISTGMLTISLCISYLIGRLYPTYFQNLQMATEKTMQRYARSLLSGADLEVVQNRLNQAMTINCIYRDEELTLSALADELELSPHQLSEYLNNNLGKSFSKFVNEFRTKEACELLLQRPYRSILDIGFEVGFRSKTSFHRVFMQNTGLTPSEFRLRGAESGSNL